MQMLDASRIFVISSIAITVFLAITISFILLRFVKNPLDNMVETMLKVEKRGFCGSDRVQRKGRDRPID